MMGKLDAVVYERLLREQQHRPLRDRFIFTNFQSLHDLYKAIAEAITNIHRERIATMSTETLAGNGEAEKISAELLDQLRLVYQGDAIDYNNLPQTWHRADLNLAEVNSMIEIFSRDNLDFAQVSLFSFFATKFPKIAKALGKMLESKGVLHQDSSNIALIPKIHRAREAKVYEKIDTLSADPAIRNMGIFYGSNHQPYLEEGLEDMGYIRTNTSYVEAVRRQPIIDGQPLPLY